MKPTAATSPSSTASIRLDFLAPPTNPNELGWLSQYRVLKVLGQGGMGIVLLAEDSELQRRVALKVIKPELGQDAETRQRFLREARAMAQVKSDHVVTIHQVGMAHEACFIAMELLEGEPLDDWLDRVTPALSESIRIGREIAMALSAAHSRGLIHRDIKPANIWLEGPARRVKLLDFGLARPQTADVRLTNTGTVVGTPAYMPPEQARGQVVDHRADLFSLGCVLYQMVTSRLPFPGESTFAILIALGTEAPIPPNQHDPKIPAPLNDLILHLLAKPPGDRPASAQEVIARLQRMEGVVPVPVAVLADASPLRATQKVPQNLESGTLHVLIVDDSALARRHVRNVLGGLGVSYFVEAVDGAAAVAAVAKESFDLIVTDYKMPFMDGSGLVGYLKQNPSTASVPIIMVTSEEDPVKLAAVRQRGVAAVCNKNFPADTVRKIIDDLVKTARTK